MTEGESGMQDQDRDERSTGTLTRLLIVPVLGLYVYLIADVLPVITKADQVVAFMLYAVMAVLLIGSIVMRLKPAGMAYIYLIAAVLQTLVMFIMALLEWRTREAVFFVNPLLVVALLLVAWQFRIEHRAG